MASGLSPIANVTRLRQLFKNPVYVLRLGFGQSVSCEEHSSSAVRGPPLTIGCHRREGSETNSVLQCEWVRFAIQGTCVNARLGYEGFWTWHHF